MALPDVMTKYAYKGTIVTGVWRSKPGHDDAAVRRYHRLRVLHDSFYIFQ